MNRNFSNQNETETYNCTDKVRKHVVIPLLIVVLLSTLACTIYSDGWNFGPDPDLDMIEDQTTTAEYLHRSIPEQSVSTQAPTTSLPKEPSDLDAEAVNVETNDYSVTATDFDCICQVDGNVTQAIRVEGEQLFLGGGGNEQVYDKISENKYKRSWMGYYISVVDGEEIRVDEEKSVVITLTDTGYVMEHFSGTSSSPCCFHTFTKIN